MACCDEAAANEVPTANGEASRRASRRWGLRQAAALVPVSGSLTRNAVPLCHVSFRYNSLVLVLFNVRFRFRNIDKP